MKSIIRSSFFLSANAFLVINFLCLSLHVAGRFYYPLNAYLPSFFGSLLAILNERPSRRKALAFYVANVASEVTYKISLSRGYIHPIPNGKFLLFSLAITILLFLYENDLLRDPLICFIFQLVIGNRNNPNQQKNDEDDNNVELKRNFWIKNHSNRIWSMMKNHFPILNISHPACHHYPKYSCFENILFTGCVKSLTIGWFSQIGLRFISKLMAGRFNDAFNIFTPNQLFSSKYIAFAMFIASFSTIYNSSLCCLKHITNNSNQSWHNILASILASPTFSFAPDTSMSLYLLWKSVEVIIIFTIID